MAAGGVVLSSGGPPVPRMRDGAWARWGAIRSLVDSSMNRGVLVPLVDMVASELFLRGVTSVRGMPSLSPPISSARAVIARLDEPRRS